MNTFTVSQKGLFACTFFLPISLFETVSDIWFYVFLHSPSCCCCCALAKLYSTLCDTRTIARQASLSSAISQNLLKLMSIESVMPSNRLILCRPLLLLPSIFPSIKVFSSESALRIRWPKYWSLSFSISPFNEYSGLISSRTDCFDLPAVQGTLKSLLWHHSSKAPILLCSAFFMVQLSYLYMTTGKTIALWTFDISAFKYAV